MKPKATLKNLRGLAIAAALITMQAPVAAQERRIPDTYKAVTVNMSPADVELKADVLRWASDAERTAVIEALALEEGVAEALRDLPTLGIVWRSGSAVGHSIKYSHREMLDDGSEHITLLTDKPIGVTSFNPWTANDTGAATDLEFGVIELTTGADGTFSLGAEVLVDAEAGTIALEPAGRPLLLAEARKEPRPYWATSDD